MLFLILITCDYGRFETRNVDDIRVTAGNLDSEAILVTLEDSIRTGIRRGEGRLEAFPYENMSRGGQFVRNMNLRVPMRRCRLGLQSFNLYSELI